MIRARGELYARRHVAAGNAGGQGYLTAFSGSIVGRERSIRVRGAAPDDPEETLSGLLETDAHAEPGDLNSLGAISGVGQSKLDRYGKGVLETLARL